LIIIHNKKSDEIEGRRGEKRGKREELRGRNWSMN
jgi:hypothetical protein